jgi:hypothetical protein
MIPFDFKYQNGSSLFALAIFVIWLVWLFLYWRALIQILATPEFGTQEKILWFLVITFVPIIGLITYWMLVPDHVVNTRIFRRKQPVPVPRAEPPQAPNPP